MPNRPYVTELAVGVGLGVILYLAVQGYNVLPVVAMGALFLLFTQASPMRAARPRTVAAGPSSSIPRIQFEEIGGQESAKKELKEALDFIVRREEIKRMGIRPLKGILLTGPPGTGKTLLAKAAATYTHSVFLAASGSEFVEMYAGVGAQRVRELFRKAREMARQHGRSSAIIFIDEIEVLGGRRGVHSSHMEYDQTLNQLLVEMDGIQVDADVQVLLIAATNRPDLLDPALMRPGRFDRTVQVDLPDLAGRRSILAIHTQGKPLAPDVDLEQVARETFGFSGAQLEALTNEAAILALRERASVITQKHLVEAVDKVILGEKLDRRPRREEKERVAIHEAGHAVVGEWVEPGSVVSVTVSPRGRAMGYVRSHPGEDRYLYTRSLLEAQIRVALAGSVAEMLIFGDRSTGAQGDFDRAVELARRIVEAGLSELGVVDPDTVDRSRVNEMVSRILKDQEAAVHDYLNARQEALRQVASLLMEREAIDGTELRALLAQAPVEPPAPAGGAVAVAAEVAAAVESESAAAEDESDAVTPQVTG